MEWSDIICAPCMHLSLGILQNWVIFPKWKSNGKMSSSTTPHYDTRRSEHYMVNDKRMKFVCETPIPQMCKRANMVPELFTWATSKTNFVSLVCRAADTDFGSLSKMKWLPGHPASYPGELIFCVMFSTWTIWYCSR